MEPSRSLLRMMEFSAGFDDALVVLIALFAFALFRPAEEPIDVGWLLLVVVVGGALLGLATWLFLRRGTSGGERLLLGLGMIAFTSGFAGWLLVSPAAVAALSGFVIANLPGPQGQRFFRTLSRVERPAIVILMTVIGTQLVGPIHWCVLPLLAAMTLLRLGAKHFMADIVAVGPLAGAPGLRTRRGWGLGLVAQGNLGLVVSLSFWSIWGGEIARAVLAAVVGASVINELLAAPLLVRALRGSAPVPKGGA